MSESVRFPGEMSSGNVQRWRQSLVHHLSPRLSNNHPRSDLLRHLWTWSVHFFLTLTKTNHVDFRSSVSEARRRADLVRTGLGANQSRSSGLREVFGRIVCRPNRHDPVYPVSSGHVLSRRRRFAALLPDKSGDRTNGMCEHRFQPRLK